jgi:hypothetical protein
MRELVVAGLLLISLDRSAALNAQSLGAIAEREADRRKHVPQGKRYTNEELPPVPVASTSDAAATASVPDGTNAAKPSPDGSPSQSAATDATPPKPPKAPPITEAEWRAQARERRARIQKFRSEISALESRLAEVERNADVSPQARSERQIYMAPLEDLRKDLQKWLAEFGRFEQKARTAQIPLEWIQ